MTTGVKVQIFQGSTEAFRPVDEQWSLEIQNNAFGIKADIDRHLADLQSLVDSESSDLLVLTEGDKIVGYMGMITFVSPTSDQLISNEHFWYVVPAHRSFGSMKLLRAAIDWARTKGCSHVIFNASYMASGLHDKVCHFYETMGMKRFETSFIREI